MNFSKKLVSNSAHIYSIRNISVTVACKMIVLSFKKIGNWN